MEALCSLLECSSVTSRPHLTGPALACAGGQRRPQFMHPDPGHRGERVRADAMGSQVTWQAPNSFSGSVIHMIDLHTREECKQAWH